MSPPASRRRPSGRRCRLRAATPRRIRPGVGARTPATGTALQDEQWIAVRAAREAAATWDQIAATTHTTAEQARAAFAARIERYEKYGAGLTDMAPYRDVL